MLLHTIVDPLSLLEPVAITAEFRPLSGGGYCECVGDGSGFSLRRIISTNPADYLRPELQPGCAVARSVSEKGRQTAQGTIGQANF